MYESKIAWVHHIESYVKIYTYVRNQGTLSLLLTSSKISTTVNIFKKKRIKLQYIILKLF